MIKEMKGETINLTWIEQDPCYFPDEPNVIDGLGLAELRKKMTAEQNRMIKIKYDICCKLEGLPTVKRVRTPKEDPFDFKAAAIPDTTQRENEAMRRALGLSALRNPKYRECAKEYLSAVIPAVSAKTQELENEIRSLNRELSDIQADYNKRIAKARRELKTFKAAVKEDAKRFYLTDRGSAKEGGAIPCERPDFQLWVGTSPSFDVEIFLDQLMGMIELLERRPDPQDAIREAVEIAKSNFKPRVRTVEASVAPYGGAIMGTNSGAKVYSENNTGFMDFLKNLGNRKNG